MRLRQRGLAGVLRDSRRHHLALDRRLREEERAAAAEQDPERRAQLLAEVAGKREEYARSLAALEAVEARGDSEAPPGVECTAGVDNRERLEQAVENGQRALRSRLREVPAMVEAANAEPDPSRRRELVRGLVDLRTGVRVLEELSSRLEFEP